MNCLLHIHVASESRDILLLCHRTTEEPNTVYIDRVVVDGITLKETVREIILKSHHKMIQTDISRKLQIRRNALTLCENLHEYL